MSMIDISSIANPVIDTQYQIVFEYQMDEIRVSVGSRPMIESAVIDLPQPDSPTTASVSPRRMTRERLRII